MDGWQGPPDSFPEVVEDPLYTEACQKLASGGMPRLDEQLRAVVWAISQEPTRFPLIPGTVVRRVKTREWPDAPKLVIHFTIDGPGLRRLLWIEPDAESGEL